MKKRHISHLSYSILLLSLINTPTLYAKSTVNKKLPPLPSLNLPKNTISSLNIIPLKEIKFEGNTIFSDNQLKKIIEKYLSQSTITAEELQDIRIILTKYYIDKDYINSGAIIPDQEIKNGIIKFKIIEGHLSEIKLLNANKLKLNENYIKNRLKNSKKTPLNTKNLQERLQILQQNPLIKRFSAELAPGLQAGEAILNLEIEENKAYDMQLGINNHRSPSVGSIRSEISAIHRNLTGNGDTLAARLGLTQGLQDYSFDYNFPINRYDTSINIHADRSDSEVISEPFNRLDIESTANSYSIGLQQIIYQSYKNFHYQFFDIGMNLNKRFSKTSLAGEPFEFSAGAKNGESHISAIRLTQNWLDRSPDRVIAITSTFSVGINALNSTINDNLNDISPEKAEIEPDSEFLVWLGQFRWISNWNSPFNKEEKSQLWLRADMQYSLDPLLPLEKFAIGGINTVRGYRENQLTLDTAAIFSIEWRIPLFQLKIPYLSINKNDGQIKIAPFFDYSWGKNNDLPTPEQNQLSSIGFGLLWSINQQIQADIYWGHALEDITEFENSDLQDEGIHFSLQVKF